MFEPAKIEDSVPAAEEKENLDPVAQTLATIVLPAFADSGIVTEPPQLNPGASVAVASYSNEQHFDYLWEFPQPLLDWLASGKPPHHARTLVLVWDGAVPQKGNGAGLAAEYVTATDWAVALAMKVEMDGSESPWRVLILDLSPHNASPPLTARLFETVKSLLPMIGVYRPTALEELLNSINIRANALSGTNRDLVNRLWAGAIVQPESPQKRHSITNLVGVRLLLRGMQGPELTAKGAIAALEHLMSALDLVPKDVVKQRRPWFDHFEWGRLVERFVLIDDMADLGWSTFLRQALNLKDHELLRVSTSPNDAVFGPKEDQKLYDLIADRNTQQLRLNADLSLTGADNEILFLDLRLFAGMASTDEQEFLRTLLPLAQKAQTGMPGLPWPGFKAQELTAVERYLGDRKSSDEDYFLALTLLPRLIALACPQLPIVLFSSTGQRTIVRLFDGFDTIITDFDKPRFFGEAPSTVVSNTATRFSQAMSRAMRILRGRKLCRQLTQRIPFMNEESKNATAAEVKGMNAPSGKAQYRGQLSAPQASKHVEIYIDESFDFVDSNAIVKVLRNGRVGGLMVVYPNKNAADAFSAMMHSHVPKLVWGYDETRVQTLSDEPLGKDMDESVIRDHLLSLAKLADLHGVHVHAFVLEASQSSIGIATRAKTPCDYLYRELLRLALESLLFLWPYARQQNTNLQIDLATRADEGNQDWARQMTERFGVFSFQIDRPPYWIALTLRHDDARPIVESLLAQRHRRISMPGAKGVTLNYYVRSGKQWTPGRQPNKGDPLPRQLHYAADWVVGYPDCVPYEWWVDGVREEADMDYDRLLCSSRLADEGKCVESLSEWGRVFEMRRAQEYSIARWVQDDLIQCARELTLKGGDFVRLCEMLPVQ